MLGYDKIPAYWKMGLKEAEDIDFRYTTICLNEAYEMGYKHALINIERNGGKIDNNHIVISIQVPQAVKFEKVLMRPSILSKKRVEWSQDSTEISFDFTGTGFALRGETATWNSKSSYIFNTELYVDDRLTESPKLPCSFTERRF